MEVRSVPVVQVIEQKMEEKLAENAAKPEMVPETAPEATSKRTGKTREHYLQQKNQSFSYFRINKEDADKLQSMQFNIYDFISASFSF